MTNEILFPFALTHGCVLHRLTGNQLVSFRFPDVVVALVALQMEIDLLKKLNVSGMKMRNFLKSNDKQNAEDDIRQHSPFFFLTDPFSPFEHLRVALIARQHCQVLRL